MYAEPTNVDVYVVVFVETMFEAGTECKSTAGIFVTSNVPLALST